MLQIGRYHVLKELGKGGMGVVYAASDPAIGRTVAIKTIRLQNVPEGTERQDLRQRLRREAQSAGVLSHPGIVTIHDIGEQGEEAYIVMEYVSGTALDKVLASGVVQHTDFLLRIIRRSAEALDYAHGKGVVHRDIKPSNIMIGEDGSVKIADFGIAKVTDSTSMTHTGIVLGTPNYMSPEQAQARPVDGRSDQFSLAVLTSQLLTGDLPFRGPTLTAVLSKILWEEPEYNNTRLNEGTRAALRRALSKDPARRFATCTEFAEALEGAVRGAGVEARPAEPESGAAGGVAPPEILPALPVPLDDSGGFAETAPVAALRPAAVGQSAPVEPGLPPLPGAAEEVASGAASGEQSASEGATGPGGQAARPWLKWMALGAALVLLGAAGVLYMRFKPSPEVAGVAPQETAPSPESAPVPEPPPPPEVAAPQTAQPPPAPSPLPAQPAAKAPLPAKKRPPAAARAPVVPQAQPAAATPTPRAAAPIAAVAELKEAPPAPPIAAPASGVVQWTGRLPKNTILVITGAKANSGAITGELPGVPVTIEVEPGSVLVRALPSEQNGFKQLMLNSGSERRESITIRWKAASR